MTFQRKFLFIACLLITGCTAVESVTDWVGGDEDNTQPPTPLDEINTRTEILELWEKDVGDGSNEQYLKLSPAIFEEKIFVANNDGDIKAISAASGEILWDNDIDKKISGGPGANNGIVLAGTSEGEVVAVSIETGEILWESKVSSEILAAPQTDNNMVVVRTIDGKIFGLNASDGSRQWIYDRTVPALTLRGTSAPIISEGLVIAGFDGGRLAAIELQTGKLIWEAQVAIGSGRSELERMVDIDAEPLILDGIIYVATYQGRIAALDIDSGSILWTRDISSYAGIGVDSQYVYITDDNSHVWALDRFGGNSVWKQEKLEARAVTAPTAFNELIVVGDVEGYLHWMDKTSGQFVARTKISSEKIIAPPISMGDMVLAYSSDGTLGAYTNHSLKEFTAPVQTEITEPETVTNQPDEVAIEETETPKEEIEKTQEPDKDAGEEKGGLWSRVLDIFSGSDDEDDDLSD